MTAPGPARLHQPSRQPEGDGEGVCTCGHSGWEHEDGKAFCLLWDDEMDPCRCETFQPAEATR